MTKSNDLPPSNPTPGPGVPDPGTHALVPLGGDAPDASTVNASTAKSDFPVFFPLWNNFITISGMYIAILALVFLLTFGLFSAVSPASNPYVDIVGYLIIPTLLGFGVALMPLGILLKSWRMHRKDPSFHTTIRFPKIDLNDPRQRRVAKIIIAGLLLFLPVLGVSSYHGYHYTDSTDFCAKACHSVMEPQATAFQASAHARVACAECHIGSGASWFVKSKLSGTRQVLAVLTGSYSRPIPPAIKHLRPARDTCEHCHWPNKFFGAQLREIAHFQSDESNTRHDVEMLVKTGGADDATGRAEGIHLHMLRQGVIEYIATDDQLQEIPWVRWVDPLGEELIYRSDGIPSSGPKPEGRHRRMDCMDCHNRPAHKFRSPDQAVNMFLDSGRIDTTLPYIKREAVAAISREYPDSETARLRIVNRIIDFYRTEYPNRYETDRASVRQAAEVAAKIYRENVFPYMRVDWRTYPDNIGHLESPGCFRCHDGQHVNQYGTPISHDCNTCHTFLETVGTDNGATLISEGQFKHPFELEGVHTTLRCNQCHDGGPAPTPTCAGCHTAQQNLFGAQGQAFAGFEIEPNPMFGSVECTDCHTEQARANRKTIVAACVDCHDEDYADILNESATALESAIAEAQAAVREVHNQLGSENIAHNEARQWVQRSDEMLDALTKANVLHNPEAAAEILKTIIKQAKQNIAEMSAGTATINTTTTTNTTTNAGTNPINDAVQQSEKTEPRP